MVSEIGTAVPSTIGVSADVTHSQKHHFRVCIVAATLRGSSEFVLGLAWPIHQFNESMLRDRFKKCVGQRSLRERESGSWAVEALRT
jgi:hypothetical protein